MVSHKILKEMIVDSSLINLVKNYDKWKVRLVETNTDDSAVEIFGIPQNTIVIKADNFPVPRNFFGDQKSELKRADYIIIAEYNNQFYSLFIEMKRGKKLEHHILSQLRGALCLYKYIEEIGKVFWGEFDFLVDHNLRFVSISKTSISKRSSRGSKKSNALYYHDTPETMLKISGSRILRFENLISKPS